MTQQPTDDADLPEVTVSTAGTVVVELEPSQAQTLARILAHYDVLVTAPGPAGDPVPAADGYDPDVWHHTLIRLLAEAANARLEVSAPNTVLVPFVRPTRSPR